MKDYYKILGVNLSAHDADIKRAFRKLAMLYHPDRDPAPAAERMFKEINEAYEVLSDPQKRAGYDWKRQRPLSNVLQEPVQPTHRDPAYRKPKQNRPNVKSERQRMFEMMSRYQPIINRITIVCLFISVFMLFDYLLPNRVTPEKITKTYSHTNTAGRYSTTYHVAVTERGQEIQLPFEVSDYFQVGHTVIINASFLLGVQRWVEANHQIVPLRKSIYGNFVFAPTALLIISFLAFMFRKNVEKSFNYGIVSLIILFFTVIIILFL